MKILAIDSSASGCHVCLWEEGAVIDVRSEMMMRGQDARLVPLIQEVMKASNTSYDDLDRIAVTRGPGSFTGLRVGLATARGLGLASEKPVVGIDRFSIYHHLLKEEDKPLCVVIDSRRQELFVKFIKQSDTALINPEDAAMLTPQEIATLLFVEKDTYAVCGDASKQLADVLAPDCFVQAKGSTVEACAALAAEAEVGAPAFLPRPLYLREPDVTLKKKESA